MPVDLSLKTLASRPDLSRLTSLLKMMENADYWLSFELARFESFLMLSPSPIRELGVGLALRFAEQIEGQLSREDLRTARSEVLADDLPGDIAEGVSTVIDILERAVTVRDQAAELESEGFVQSEARPVLSPGILQAMGRATVHVEGQPDNVSPIYVPLGSELIVSATDEKGRPIEPPVIENAMGPPVWMRTEDRRRWIVIAVPGMYALRSPFKAEGARKVIAR